MTTATLRNDYLYLALSAEYLPNICRTREGFEYPGSFTAAAECWGDVGAASGPLALTLPLAACSRGYAKGPVTLACSSSARAPLRAAALLKQTAAPAN